jgi:flagellar hook-associated protein FlgK
LGIKNQIHTAVFNGTDWLTQDRAIFKVKDPKVNTTAPNGYTQGRAEALIRRPMVLDNGNSTFNSVWAGLSCDVETTAAEKLSLRLLAAQLLTQSAFADFYDDLGLS